MQEEARSNPRHGKLGRQQFFKIDLKGMPSQEEHKTVVRCLMISNMIDRSKWLKKDFFDCKNAPHDHNHKIRQKISLD